MNTGITKTTLLFVILGLVAVLGSYSYAAAENLPTVEEVLARYIEVMGGREAIEKLTTRKCVATEITDLTSREMPIYESYQTEATADSAGRLYMVTWTDSEIYRQGYDGKTGWVKDKCGVKQKDYIGKDRLAWLLNPHNALVVEDYFPGLEMKGTALVRGMTVYVLESAESHRPLFFDSATGLLIGFGYNWEIHDYRMIDGVLFPHKILISRKGGSTAYEFTEIRHNDAIADSIFAMPAD